MIKYIFIFLLLVFFVLLPESSWSYKKVILKAPTGGDFTIPGFKETIDTKKFRGKNIFLYFGFTQCPHICPLTLSRLKHMINMLPENEKENVRVIFVSVDNERDTLQSLQKYIHPNGIQFVAGTADDKKLHAILAKYGARYARFRTKNKVLLVDHTDNVFVINKNGLWTDTLNFNSTPEQFLEAFRASDKITSETSKLGKNIQSIQLGKNNKCDLAKNECKIELPDHQTISVRLTPFPIKAQSDFTVSVKVTSDKLIPQEVDFNGVQLNMGYIRPALMLQEDGSYSATLNLPICELRKMQWKVSVILKDSLSRYFSTLFFFETKD